MQIKITPVERYTVEIDGHIVGVFDMEPTEWNGMVCLKSDIGKIIADLTEIFPYVFGQMISGNKSRTGTVIKATPSIIDGLKN